MNKQRKKSKLNEFNPTQVYIDIKTKYEQNRDLYKDDEFVADPEVLTNDVESRTIVINYMGRKHVRKAEISWLRPWVSYA